MRRFAGYWIGVGSRLSSVIGRGGDLDLEEEEIAPTAPTASSEKKKEQEESGEDDDEDEEEYSSSEDEDGPVEGLDKIKAGFMEECKLVSFYLFILPSRGEGKGWLTSKGRKERKEAFELNILSFPSFFLFASFSLS